MHVHALHAQESNSLFSTSIRSARNSSKALKKVRKQDVTSNGLTALRSWVWRVRRGVRLDLRLSVRRTGNMKDFTRYAQSNEYNAVKERKWANKEGKQRREQRYLHGPRNIKDVGPRNPNWHDPPDLDHQARKMLMTRAAANYRRTGRECSQKLSTSCANSARNIVRYPFGVNRRIFC